MYPPLHQIFMLCMSITSLANGSPEFDPKSKWYTRYSQYPEYCSTEEQMNERAIPTLNSSDDGVESELLHVTAIIRHGARTPWTKHVCWSGWDEQKWDCELKTMTSPPSQPEILQLEKNGAGNIQIDGEGAMFLFEKNYDALHDPPQLKNTLNGTCQTGQLLLRGYVQELHNGRMLRKAYTKEKKNDDSDGSVAENMVLFDLNQDMEHRPYEEPSLYYRSDDDQRTIMSGQVLLRGLFGDIIQQHSEELGAQIDPTIAVHTADRSQDILSPNPKVCPRLQDLYDEATKSKEYIDRFVKSEESKAMQKIATEQFHADMDMFQFEALDCLMTAICNDRDLPSVLDDFGDENGNHNFDRMNKYVSEIRCYQIA